MVTEKRIPFTTHPPFHAATRLLCFFPVAGLMVQYYGERTYARFYALETIARVPYFGYLCVLHLYETLGQWRQVSRPTISSSSSSPWLAR